MVAAPVVDDVVAGAVGGRHAVAAIPRVVRADTAPVAAKLAEAGLDAVGSTPDELAAYQRAEIAKWAKVVKDSGAKVE